MCHEVNYSLLNDLFLLIIYQDWLSLSDVFVCNRTSKRFTYKIGLVGNLEKKHTQHKHEKQTNYALNTNLDKLYGRFSTHCDQLAQTYLKVYIVKRVR